MIRAALLALFAAGCASHPGPPPLADLAGTNWRVVTVNGRPTPALGDYSVRFDHSSSVGACFGCNAMGGRYTMVGGTLTVGDLSQTLMGCADPAGTFEREGSAILSQPMQVSFTSNDRMSLANAAGAIALDPL